MARLNDEAQWMILMAFIVSFSFFFLALVINQSTIVGQTTAESVIEFPKNDIRDVRNVIIQSGFFPTNTKIHGDIINISLSRKSAVVDYTFPIAPCTFATNYNCTAIHYNNGVTIYNENWTSR